MCAGDALGFIELAAFTQTKIDLLLLMEGKSLYTVYNAPGSVKKNSVGYTKESSLVTDNIIEVNAPLKNVVLRLRHLYQNCAVS